MVTALIGAAAGILGAILGWFAPRSRSLDSQREDFKSVLEPVLSELRDLRERVKTLEAQHVDDVRQHYKDQRRIDVLVDYVQDLLAFIRLHVPSPEPPPIPVEISNDI
ncbi:YtxH domain-containing protein [Nocardia otitidiscaviarum]|uniref:YtxH domain-containing protein n=1 Tax=Nocardia otitidiscaviarum TaxID=1823 RepID=UPI002457EEDE|nr:YtxH domain-containing protein [Nocardia otitidiscaviarum]